MTSPVAGSAPARTPTTGSGVFGAFSSKRIEAERRSRLPLYMLIAAAILVLAVGAWWKLGRPAPAAPVPSVRATPLPVSLPTPASAGAALPTPAPTAALDPKAIEEEVARQLAARRKELQKALDTGAKAREGPAKKGETPAPAAASSAATPAEEEVAPTPSPIPVVAKVVPTEAPPVVEVPPTAVPVRAVPPPRSESPEVSRGELVGPGNDVVEPTLIAAPKVLYPPLARQQRVTGKVIVLVLVDEDGRVAEARLQQGIPSRTGVNEAVLEGVRGARFRPATKSGIPVKMSRTLVIDVKP